MVFATNLIPPALYKSTLPALKRKQEIMKENTFFLDLKAYILLAEENGKKHKKSLCNLTGSCWSDFNI